jgi:subtilisin family serine protease
MASLRNTASAPKAAGKKTARAKAAPGAGPRAADSPSAPADSVVVYVHGIGAKPPKSELKLQWDLALFGRDLGDRSRMAYWADLRRPTAEADSAAPASGAKRARGAKATLDVEALLPPKSGETEHLFAVRLLQHFGTQVVADEAGPAAQGPRKKLLPLPAWARRPISEAFLKAFIADTAAYFFAAGMRSRICRRLADELQQVAGKRITVVAHSQGSVIAYEVLSAMKATGIAIDALITIGSPLGIQEVQDFLEPADGSIPKAVNRWQNLSDPLDPVALDKGLASDFRALDGRSVRVQDEIIVNGQSRRLWGFNPHSAVGYLAHPAVRRVVNDAMRMDVMARFVIARDVAERLGTVTEERHAVLIEVLEPGYRALGEDREQTQAVESEEVRQLPRNASGGAPGLRLEHRIATAARRLRSLVSDPEAARIDELRRFVAAHLTAHELRQVGKLHRDLRIYAVWQSSRKSKLTDIRSMSTIKADAALASFGADGQRITWAVLDTGIQANHPHFKDAIKAVYDCTHPGPPKLLENAVDADGHGTHVAGIIAGGSEPGVEVGPDGERDLRGVAPRARLVVYKVLNDEGQGEDAWIIKALDHIAGQNENVADGLAIHGINLSLGGPFDHTVYGCGFSPICAELRRLWRNGVLVVVACGNEGQLQVQTPDGEVEINTPMSVGDPANLEECIAVGSVHADRPHLYGISPFSSRGPTADGRAKPDLVAPGERILSCNAHWKMGKKDHYYAESGTSMAAPHVSGLLAAFLSVRREFRGRPDEVKKILLASCIDLGRDRYHQGRGLPNLMQMLLAV